MEKEYSFDVWGVQTACDFFPFNLFRKHRFVETLTVQSTSARLALTYASIEANKHNRLGLNRSLQVRNLRLCN